MSEPVGYGLSAQQRLHAAGQGSGTVSLSLELPSVAAASAHALVQRAAAAHEVFRSTLATSAALRDPVQIVGESAAIGWQDVPPDADLTESLGRLAAGVDAATGPVLWAGARAESDGCTLLLAASTAFCDLGTLTALAAEVAGGEPVDDPIQYVEYAAWQSDLISAEGSPDAVTAGATWGRLADPEVAGVALPDVGHHPDAGGGGLVAADGQIPGDAVAWWLSRWAVTTYRLTGEREALVHVELDPRTNPELAGAAGPYQRIVPLVLTVPVTGTLSAFQSDVAERLEQARTWLEWAPPPVGPVRQLVSRGPATAIVSDDPARAHLQVELRVADSGDGAVVVGGPSGSPTLTARVTQALTRVATVADGPVEDLEALDPAELDALLGAAPSAAVDPTPVVERVRGHAVTRADHVALTDGHATVSYAELETRVAGLAAALRAAALRAAAGDGPVVVSLPRSLGAVVAMLAAQRSGRGVVALDPEVPVERYLGQVEVAGAALWVTEGDVPAGATRVPPDASAPADTLETVTAEDLAYVLFTSGSTGVPKAVAVGQRSLSGYVDAVTAVVEGAVARPAADLVWGHVTGLTTDLGNTSLYGALAAGGTVHLVPSDLVQDPAALATHLRGTPIDVLKITPTHLEALLADVRADVLPRELVILGGEALGAGLVTLVAQRGACRVLNHYGPTETTVGALTHLVPSDDRLAAAARDASVTVPIGGPLPGYEALVVDERLRLLPAGAVGELVIGGAGLARGYLGDDEASAAAFVDHPYRPGARVYRTGDRVRLDPDGEVTFLGRRDGQVKLRGHRIETREVELALTGHPEVRRAAVVLRNDGGGGPQLVAYVVTQVNPTPSEASLRAHVAASLPEHMVPSRVVDVDSLPLRGNGKLDVAALPVPPVAGSVGSVAPRGETELAVAATFCEALGLDRVGAEDDFFALGGHSLLATRVAVDLRDRLQVQLPVHTLFDAPTVRALAAEIDRLSGAPTPEELAAMIEEIASLSDEEAARLLAEESGAHPSWGGPPETPA